MSTVRSKTAVFPLHWQVMTTLDRSTFWRTWCKSFRNKGLRDARAGFRIADRYWGASMAHSVVRLAVRLAVTLATLLLAGLPYTAAQELQELSNHDLESLLRTVPRFTGQFWVSGVSGDFKQVAVQFLATKEECEIKECQLDKVDKYIGLIDLNQRQLLAYGKVFTTEDDGWESIVGIRWQQRELITERRGGHIAIRDTRTLEITHLFAGYELGLVEPFYPQLHAARLAAGGRFLVALFAEHKARSILSSRGSLADFRKYFLGIFDLDARTIRARCPVEVETDENARPIAISGDGALVAYGRPGSERRPQVYVASVESCKTIRAWSFDSNLADLAFSADDASMILTFNRGATKALVQRLSDTGVILRVPSRDRVDGGLDSSFAVSPSGRWLAIDSSVYRKSFWELFSEFGHVENSGVDLWDLGKGRIAGRVRFGQSKIHTWASFWDSFQMVFSQDEQALAVFAPRSTLRFYRVPISP